MKILPKSIRGALIRAGRDFCSESVIRSVIPKQPLGHPVSLHLVVSAKTWKMGLLALRSLEWTTGRTWSPFIHEDGTLTQEMHAELAQLQPDATFVSRTRGDALCAEMLSAYPACKANRTKHNWFLKFFDTFFTAPGTHYIVLDSDILFFRRPDEIMTWIEQAADTVHLMEDTREAYASPREELEAAMGFPFWRMVNSGICLMPKASVDLALAERFLERFSETAKNYMFLEQSLFALTGSAWNRGGLLPKTYEISWNNFRARNSICRHYVGPFKDDALYVEGATSFWLNLKLGRRPSLLG